MKNSKKYTHYAKIFGFVFAIFFFLAIKFIEMLDTVGALPLLVDNYSLRAYWYFYVNWQSAIILAVGLLLGFVPYVLLTMIELIKNKMS